MGCLKKRIKYSVNKSFKDLMPFHMSFCNKLRKLNSMSVCGLRFCNSRTLIACFQFLLWTKKQNQANIIMCIISVAIRLQLAEVGIFF